MPIAAKSDGNVPFLPGRARYNILGMRPTWITHVMAAGTLDGAAPVESGKTAAETDPVVSAGQAVFSNLTAGGLFTLLGNYRRAVLVEEMIASGTVSTVDASGTSLRTGLTAPFTLAPGEYLKVVGGASAKVLVRLASDDTI